MIQVSLVGYATSGAVLGLAYFDFYYGLVAIMILCKVQVMEYLKQESKAARGEAAPVTQGSMLDQIEHAADYRVNPNRGPGAPTST
jgi:hypothetical protein